MVVASDGHTAAIVHDPEGRAPATGIILPIGKGQAVVLSKGGHVFADESGRAFITNHDGEILWIAPERKIEGNFPDIQAVLGAPDQYEPGLTAECNPEYLDRIRRARKASGKSRYAGGIRWWHSQANPQNGPILAAIAGNALAVIMPLRSDGEDRALAEYLPPSLRRAAKRAKAA